MELAGRDDLTTPVTKWVNNWLRQTYLSWDYPFLHRDREALSLPAGTASLVVGAGSGGITNEIQRVLDPIWIYTSDYTVKDQVRLRPLTGGRDTRGENRIQDPNNSAGIPTQFRVRPYPNTYGKWTLEFLPIPDRAYLITFDYIELPALLVAADVPVYPNDLTLVQAAHVATMLHSNGHDSPDYQDGIQVLAKRVTEDKARFGHTPGINDVVPLNEGIFR
ncbi:MAG TPA: hypothetical protein VHL57_07500 [Flavobacteriales bacterium]|nr:hypothetical protein [Flavobacteriales bacterium]